MEAAAVVVFWALSRLITRSQYAKGQLASGRQLLLFFDIINSHHVIQIKQ